MVEPINLEFDDDILCVEYESFSCGLDENKGLDIGFCVQYKSFSLNPLLVTLSLRNPSLNF